MALWRAIEADGTIARASSQRPRVEASGYRFLFLTVSALRVATGHILPIGRGRLAAQAGEAEAPMPGTPRLSHDDLDALRALASGETTVSNVSRYWLSVYQLIDETPAGWHLTPRGRDFLWRLATQKRGDAVPGVDARF